jgi:catechol 2,3-dioxygenase-like lactoylglutathione lyase family enzyme
MQFRPYPRCHLSGICNIDDELTTELNKGLSMFFGVTHIDVPVTDFARAEAIWSKLIGLREIRRGEGFVDLDSGSVILRLVLVEKVARPVSLRVNVPDVQLAYNLLVQHGGRPLYEVQRTPALELEAHVADADGNSVIVWRELTEDEFGFVPELPKQGEWQPDAEALLNELLAYVPALFRSMARRKVTRIVEEVAGYDNSSVTREHVIRGYILSSAKIKRDRLVEPLRKCGINPDCYSEEFAA